MCHRAEALAAAGLHASRSVVVLAHGQLDCDKFEGDWAEDGHDYQGQAWVVVTVYELRQTLATNMSSVAGVHVQKGDR